MKRNNKKNNIVLLWDTTILTLNTPTNLSKSIIEKAITDFWKAQVDDIDDNHHIISIFRVVSETGIYQTIGNLQKLSKNDKNYFINYVYDNLSIKSNDYKDTAITKVIINYGIRKGIIAERKSIKPTSTHQNYKHYKLPITMDPLKYGHLLHIDKALNMYLVQVTDLTTAKIFVKKNLNLVYIMKSGHIILSFEDQKINENKFERIIGSKQYIYIKDNEDEYKLDLFSVVKPMRYFKSKNPAHNLSQKFITMDIETYDKRDEHGVINKILYNLTWYNGNKVYSYFINDFNSCEDLIANAIKDITRAQYHSYKIYIHNFAKFDAVFLLKELIKFGIVYPIFNNGRLVTVNLTYCSKKNPEKIYDLDFRDSYQLLPSSLRKLATSFNVDTQKSIFPHKFISESNIDYIGNVPSFEYFDGVKYEDYKLYCNTFQDKEWNLKTEAINYCIQDCVSLYQVIDVFNNLIFKKFMINMNKYPTLSSLSFGIFLTCYLPLLNLAIPMLSGQIAKNIRMSYTGGSTDMYIPLNENNELVYGYDVNSLYASVMNHNVFPIGKPTYFEGDIRKYQAEAFGFFYCKITAPDNLQHPIIQLHVKTKSGMRTVSPTGTFKTMLFSEEMDNAIKLGYKFEILWGYVFKKGRIFHDYVTDLYNIRLEYDKSHPMNYIAKLLLNSLYGRFGMDDNFSYCSFMDKEQYIEYDNKYSDKIINVTDFDYNLLVEVKGDQTKAMLNDRTESHKVNVAIASAITAYARIYMSQFKNNPNIKLFYTDTDSIFTNLNPDEMNNYFPNIVNNKELGKLKLESISTKSIFIAPKVYYLKTMNNEEIYKVKGLNKNVILTEQEFQELLMKDSILQKSQDKWFKDISHGVIEVKPQLYTLQQTDNKRELIYNSNNQLIGTKPYKLENNELSTDTIK